LATEWNTPSGKNSSGPNTDMVPVKPRGVMPTTVNGRSLTRTVDPTSAGSKLRRCQKAQVATTTGTSWPGRLSSAVKPRPAATGTPSTSKQLPLTITPNVRRDSLPSVTPTSAGTWASTPAKPSVPASCW
jgi:hypothetical protein